MTGGVELEVAVVELSELVSWSPAATVDLRVVDAAPAGTVAHEDEKRGWGWSCDCLSWEPSRPIPVPHISCTGADPADQTAGQRVGDTGFEARTGCGAFEGPVAPRAASSWSRKDAPT